MGKKIGIVALICTIAYIICGIIVIAQAPEIPDDVYDLMLKDQEAYIERFQEITDNASTLYKVADKGMIITGLGGIVLSIVSIVKLVKAKEKGKIIPILSIIIIIVFYFVTAFSVVDFGAAFQAGFDAGMEMAE
jgi:hypothetical protein